MNEQQRTELYLFILANEAARNRNSISENWQRGYYAGYLAAMETVLDVLKLEEDFKKWSEDHAEN